MGLFLEIVRYQPLAATLISTSVLIKPNQFVLRSVRQFVAGTLKARQSRNKSFGTPAPQVRESAERRHGDFGSAGEWRTKSFGTGEQHTEPPSEASGGRGNGPRNWGNKHRNYLCFRAALGERRTK